MDSPPSSHHRARVLKGAASLQDRLARLLHETVDEPVLADESLAEIEAILEAVADVDEEIERRRFEEKLRFAWTPCLAFAESFRREFRRIDVTEHTLTTAHVLDWTAKNAFVSFAQGVGFSLTRDTLAPLLADEVTAARWLQRQFGTAIGRSAATVRNIMLFRRR